MKKIQFYTGLVSLGIAIALFLLDLTTIKVTFSDTSHSTMSIYPAAFFTLLGVSLVYHGLKPLWRNLPGKSLAEETGLKKGTR